MLNFIRILILFFLSLYSSQLLSDNPLDEQLIIDRDINIIPENIPFFDIYGNKHFFDELDNGSITTLIVFWASWVNESPDLIAQLDRLKKDFRKLKFNIVALSEDYHSIDKIQEFFDKHEIRYLQIYHDYKNAIYNSMQITNLPAFFLLNYDANKLYQVQGRINWDSESIRNSLLGFIPGNPVIPKNSSTKSLLEFSPDYKEKLHLKKLREKAIQEKDLLDSQEQDKNIVR